MSVKVNMKLIRLEHLMLAFVLLAGQTCLASPSIGKHHLSFKIPKLSSFKSHRANSMSVSSRTKTDDDSVSGSSQGDKSQAPLARFSSTKVTGSPAMNTGESQFGTDCSKEAFDKAFEAAKSKMAAGLLESVDTYMSRHLKRCETILARQLINLKERSINSEQEESFNHFREIIKESEDHTDFESDRLDRHVPQRNLSAALIQYMNEKKKLVDPRSENYNFKAILKEMYEKLCSPINNQFREILDQYDVLDKMSHLHDATAETEDTLIEWMANVRICSYIPNNVDELMKDTADLLLAELGDDTIDDPEEDYADLTTIFDGEPKNNT